MKILVLGNGGREHSIVSILKETNPENKIFAYPGNPGIYETAEKIDVQNIDELLEKITDFKFDLVIIGPEKYLEDGISDILRDKKISVFGPSKKAAQLETSKIFGKKFLLKNKIPTADFRLANNKIEAMDNIKNYPVVLKYDGLAAGKGVSVCNTINEALKFFEDVFDKNKFGKYKPLLIEKYLKGKELSVICAVSNNEYRIFPFARDYKKLLDNDEGSNTGGMGAIASMNLIDKNLANEIKENIIERTIIGLKNSNLDYKGFLYFGLILTERGPEVLEFNCRFGDPEAQVILPLINGDVAEYLKYGADGRLKNELLSFSNEYSLCVVAAAPGYPDEPVKGLKITGLEKINNCRIFHSGTIKIGSDFFTNGGRVVGIADTGSSIEKIQNKVYSEMRKLNWAGIHYRTDIGKI